MAYVALLRAINVAGYGALAMADLRAFFEQLGFEGARTLMQTGNVIFEAARQDTAKIETLLEAEAARQLKLTTVFMVRTASEWSRLVAANPFPAAARADPAHLLAMFLKSAPMVTRRRKLQSVITGREKAVVKGKVAYVTFPDGVGRSKFTNAVLERALNTRSTGRNWNTVLKIGQALQSP